MINIENTEVYGWEAAIRGMRNPMNSWGRSDSTFSDGVRIGPNDMKLMVRLAQAGSDHGKFLRMVGVSCDIRAPFYWWKEFDTYKVGTVANSCSTMHKLTAKPFEASDFCTDGATDWGPWLSTVCDALNALRGEYLETGDKRAWRSMVQMLPMSYMQRRTVSLNYAVLGAMYRARKGHRLSEWQEFREWCEGLPHFVDLTVF